MCQWVHKDEVNDYIRDHWSEVCTGRDKTPTWWATVGSAMYESKDLYDCESQQRSASLGFFLVDRDIMNLRPPEVRKNKKTSSRARPSVPGQQPRFFALFVSIFCKCVA